MMEGWNDGTGAKRNSTKLIMENKRLDFCLYPPFFQFSIIPLIQIK